MNKFLSDKQVAESLTRSGIKTTSRTVAKWRKQGLDVHGYKLVRVGVKRHWVASE